MQHKKGEPWSMDDAASPDLVMASSGFLPPETLLESLILASNELSSIDKTPFLQRRNITTMIRRITLLSSLFEEIQEQVHTTPLPPSSMLCLTELYSVIQRVRSLIQSSLQGSLIWSLMQTENVSIQFHGLVKEMGGALDILPLSLLNLSADTREQVELLHRQARRAQVYVDQMDSRRRDELLDERSRKSKGFVDFARVRDILISIGLDSLTELQEEIKKLEAEAEKQAGTGGLVVVSNINSLISLISVSKTIDKEEEDLTIQEDMKKRKVLTSSHSFSSCAAVPDEFRCPISLDLMNEPVIVASGHTYDRSSIAQWINSGHHTCPKSGQRLIHMALIPNYALRSLIQQWCQENMIESPSLERSSSSKRRSCDAAIDHISVTKAAADAVKMTAEFLVGKLATGSRDIQRQAAFELRLLAKTGMENRRIIAEAGAIPFLVTLLTSPDSRIQENSITALLNLSIHENNKMLIMVAGAIDSIVEVLQSGQTMEAKANAAATIFSLSIIGENKAIIGAHPRAIPALVQLLGEGTAAGKRDAATALFNLALFNGNRGKVIVAGTVPLLIELLMDDKAGITDDALAVLALLLGCEQGLEEIIRRSRDLVPLLIGLLRFGSSKGKENAITLLLGLCKDGGEEVARRLLMNPFSIPCLQRLTSDGSLKARRKADALLRILNRCCSYALIPAV